MLNNKISIFKIRINLFDFWKTLILIFAGMQYKLNSIYTFIKVFVRITTIIKPIVIACFFETIYHSIFKHFFAADSKDKELFGHISTYFGKIDINCWGILYFYYLIWLCSIIYITNHMSNCKQTLNTLFM